MWLYQIKTLQIPLPFDQEFLPFRNNPRDNVKVREAFT